MQIRLTDLPIAVFSAYCLFSTSLLPVIEHLCGAMYHSSSEPRGPLWEGLMFSHGSLLRGPVVVAVVYILKDGAQKMNSAHAPAVFYDVSSDGTIDAVR